jgi:hypothetical protein
MMSMAITAKPRPSSGNTGNGCGAAVGRQAHRRAIKAGAKGAVKLSRFRHLLYL